MPRGLGFESRFGAIVEATMRREMSVLVTMVVVMAANELRWITCATRSTAEPVTMVLTRCIQRCWIDRARLVHVTGVYQRQR